MGLVGPMKMAALGYCLLGGGQLLAPSSVHASQEYLPGDAPACSLTAQEMRDGAFVHPPTFSGGSASAIQLTQVYTDSLRLSMGGMGLMLMGGIAVICFQLGRIEDALKEKGRDGLTVAPSSEAKR